MVKECGAWVSRRLWGGGNTSPLKMTAWEGRRWVNKTEISEGLGDVHMNNFSRG